MKVIIIYLIAFLFLSCEDIGKDYKWLGDRPPGFARHYGTIGYDYGWSAAYSPFDEGVIIVGQQAPKISGKYDLWAIKTDNRGSVVWDKKFGGSENEVGYDVVSTSDGGFIFVGYSWSYGNEQQVYVIKTDFYGNIEWEKNYGGSMWDVGNSVIEVSTGGYLIAGYSNSPRLSSGNSDMYLIRINSFGNIIWEKAYGNKAFPNHEWAYDIIEIENENFMVVGSRDRYDKGSRNAIIMRIDSIGNIIWEKEILDDLQIDESAYSISKSQNGSYYICTTTNSEVAPNIFQPKIIKIDSMGNIDWQRIFNSNGKDYHQYRATATSSGEIVIVGSSGKETSLGYKEDAFMTKIDFNGNILWSYPYGTADEDDWGWSVFETPKNNLVFVGSTKSYGSSLFDVLLVGTNADGITE